MKQLFIISSLFLTLSCVPHNFENQISRWNKVIDSLSNVYLVDVELNKDYINSHKVTSSETKQLEALFIQASPSNTNASNVNDAIGVFSPRMIKTDEQNKRVEQLKDSIRESLRPTIVWIGSTESLTNKSNLYYNFGYRFVGNDSIILLKSEAIVIDKNSNDSTNVSITDLFYNRVCWAPLVFAIAFKIESEGHQYLIHHLYDVRASAEKREGMPKKTTGCYQVR